MEFIADLHIHSRFSRATSKSLDFAALNHWAAVKGISVVGTGDCTHPVWLSEVNEQLDYCGNGLFSYKNDKDSNVRFVLTGEVSTIYKAGGKTRKVHHVVCLSDYDAALRFAARLERIGNIKSDGRPILGLDSRDLLETLLEADPEGMLIPAHIWTPWFSVLGSKSGFDSIEECYRDLAGNIFAVETGLSSDPPMNWMVSSLDKYTLVSNSDAHSAGKLGREANIFDCDVSYGAMMAALKNPAMGFKGTLEFFPQEGKYHFDGHRNCNICFDPAQSRAAGGICPVCNKPLVLGVMYRVVELADRKFGQRPVNAPGFESLLGLENILAEVMQAGSSSRKVKQEYERLISELGPELHILRKTEIEELKKKGSPLLAEAIARVRSGNVSAKSGYDGEFGVITVFSPEEQDRLKGQHMLFVMDNDRIDDRKTAQKNLSQAGSAESKKKQTEKKEEAIQLNDQQLDAVNCPSGPVIITAGPGTGKTRTLIERIIWMIIEKGAASESILALTFSNRAANEMRERLDKALSALGRKNNVGIYTFHGFAYSLIQSEPARFGFSGVPQIVENKEIIALEQGEFCDYQDLLELSVKALSEEAFCRQCKDKFKAVLVDEYQDINELQYKMVRFLTDRDSELFVIGDPDQSIYAFRGSDNSYFKGFTDDYPGAQCIELVRNYRSSQEILDASSAMISSCMYTDKTKIWSGKYSAPVIFTLSPTPASEAEQVVKYIEDLLGGTSSFALNSGRGQNQLSDSIDLGDIAVLYRNHSLSNEIEEALKRSAIPFQRVIKSGISVLNQEYEDYDPRADAVTLMTMHASKGLEWKAVFIIGCQEDTIPFRNYYDDPDIDEERRLFYVAMTRAKEFLLLSYSQSKRSGEKIKEQYQSKFIDAIPSVMLDKRKPGQAGRARSKDSQLSMF